MTVRVVLVRPWLDGRGGGGCCGGEVTDGVAPPPLARDTGHRHPTDTATDTRSAGDPHEHTPDPVAQVYRRLRADHPELDVQVTPANNVWLLGWSFSGVRRRRGIARALAASTVAARPGAVLVDGQSVAELVDGPDRVSDAVARELARSSPTTR